MFADVDLGTNLTTYVDCIYDQLSRVYDNGGRYFVLINNAPLQWAPEYAAPPNDVGANQYWPDKPKNHTLLAYRMLEQVVTVNSIFDYRTPVDVVLEHKWPGASFAVFDVNGLVSDRHLTNHACQTADFIADDRYSQQSIAIPEWYGTTERRRLHPPLQHYRRRLRDKKESRQLHVV